MFGIHQLQLVLPLHLVVISELLVPLVVELLVPLVVETLVLVVETSFLVELLVLVVEISKIKVVSIDVHVSHEFLGILHKLGNFISVSISFFQNVGEYFDRFNESCSFSGSHEAGIRKWEASPCGSDVRDTVNIFDDISEFRKSH